MKLSVYQLILVGLLTLMTGCFGHDSSRNNEPANTRQIIFEDDSVLPGIVFDKQVVFMDSLYLDNIHDIAVDRNGIVFLSGEKWNHMRIHRFLADGDYAGHIGQLGNTPGSFQEADRLQVSDSALWVSDPELRRISKFDPSTGDFMEAVDIDTLYTRSDFAADLAQTDITPVGLLDGSRILLIESGKRNPAYQPEWQIQYTSLTLNENGQPEITRLFKGMAQRYMVGDYAGRPAAFTLSINEQPFIDFKPNGLLYAANSSDFYVRVYSQEGGLLRTYAYPYERLELNPDDDIFPSYTYNRQLLMVRESAEYPKFWPALYHMLLDDEKRIWVSTVVEDREMSEWFVIDDRSQELIARFMWPVDKPIRLVKNGTAYTIEKNSAGFEVVAAYNISFQ
ncbi:hypothetical protein [Rhodohalobacter sp. 8-1]|uniref:hypothetical protein n=1 Tax=Rhodohalobacter sp. 8-1 TaxID=3131972 RepID=UPI0030EE6355